MNNHNLSKIGVIVTAFFASTTINPNLLAASPATPSAEFPLTISELPASLLRTQLAALPDTKAKSIALSKLQSMNISQADLAYLNVTNNGNVYFFCLLQHAAK